MLGMSGEFVSDDIMMSVGRIPSPLANHSTAR
jgi:hypothetical protein